MGSIESEFQFVRYKIDKINMQTTQKVANLPISSPSPDQIEITIGIRDPQRLSDGKIFVGGLNMVMDIYERKTNDPELDKKEMTILHGEFGIAGLFRVSEGSFSPDTIDKLVRFQIPAILMPFLRSAVTCFLSLSGYGSITLPLINVQALALEHQNDIQVEDIRSNPENL